MKKWVTGEGIFLYKYKYQLLEIIKNFDNFNRKKEYGIQNSMILMIEVHSFERGHH